MSASKLKVLISGAGIAGPCLAYWLTRTRLNAAITIIERSPNARATGQSIDIRGPAIEIMKAMKLEEAVRSRLTTEEGTSFLNDAGKPFARFATGGIFTADYEILRADLSGLFLEATECLGNVEYKYGDSIKSLEQTKKGATVTFTGGWKQTYDLVVAADGSTSMTRPMILDDHVLKNSYNFIGQYTAFFSIPSRPNDPKRWQWYNSPKGLCIMSRPHRNSSTLGVYLNIVTPTRGQRNPVVEEAMEKGIDATKRMLHSFFDDAGWEAKRVLEGMDAADDFYMSRAAQVKLPKWTNGRGVVLGDAAHATLGVGTSLAIEGAYILAGELSKIERSEEVPRALERFEEVFRPLYGQMEELPSGYPQMLFPQTVWGLSLRDAVLWLVSKTRLYKLFQGGGSEEFELPKYDWME